MIGFVIAEKQELEELLSIVDNIKYCDEFILGKIKNHDVVICKSSVGKVNAALTTQKIIDKFNISIIINIGVSGSVNNMLNIKDIVIGTKLYQFDFDTSAFERDIGEIENVGKYIECNVDEYNLSNYKLGVLGTSDKFITDNYEKKRIRDEFGIDCVDMESGAIAQVCYLNNVKFLIIRSISDKMDGSSKIEFSKFISDASKEAVKLIYNIL